MIAIIDYGMGNLGSVEKALAYLGYRSVITDSPREAMTADGMIRFCAVQTRGIVERNAAAIDRLEEIIELA